MSNRDMDYLAKRIISLERKHDTLARSTQLQNSSVRTNSGSVGLTDTVETAWDTNENNDNLEDRLNDTDDNLDNQAGNGTEVPWWISGSFEAADVAWDSTQFATDLSLFLEGEMARVESDLNQARDDLEQAQDDLEQAKQDSTNALTQAGTALDEANRAKAAAQQNAADILTLDSKQNQTAAEARDAWNSAQQAMEAALSGGGNLYPDPGYELGGAGLAPADFWEIVETPQAREGTHALTQRTGYYGTLGVPATWQPCSGEDVAYGEAWVLRTDAAQTGIIQLNINTRRLDGTTGSSTLGSLNLEDVPVGVWQKISGQIRVTTATGQSERTGWRVYLYAVSTSSAGVLVDSVKHLNITQAYEALEAAQQAQNDATAAATKATTALTAADGKTRIWRSTLGPAAGNTQGSVGDVWWRYSNADFTGPVIGQWTRTSSGWSPTQIRSEVIESLTVDKLAVTGGAQFPVAVIDSLVADSAFVRTMYTNQLIVGADDMAPGPGGFESLWTFGALAGTETSDDPSGKAIFVNAGSGTVRNRYAYGPAIRVAPGTKVFVRLQATLMDGFDTSGQILIRFGTSPSDINTFASWSRLSYINSSGWYEGEVTVPAGKSYVRIDLGVTSGTTGRIVFSNITAKPQVGTVLIENGAITGDKVMANTITGDKLVADSITGDKLVARSITGDRIVANSITADEIAANAITSNKIAGNAIDGKTITGALIRTAPSGQRLELKPGGLYGYSASGSLVAGIYSGGDGIRIGSNMSEDFITYGYRTTIGPSAKYGADGAKLQMEAVYGPVRNEFAVDLSPKNNNLDKIQSISTLSGPAGYVSQVVSEDVPYINVTRAFFDITSPGSVDLYSTRIYTANNTTPEAAFVIRKNGDQPASLYLNEAGAVRVYTREGSSTTTSAARPIPFATAAGLWNTQASIAAGAGREIAITYPPGRFTSVPRVFATVGGSSRLQVAVINRTRTGCTLRVDNFTTAAASPDGVDWLAVQMTPTSYAG